jgi:hypothetical protein
VFGIGAAMGHFVESRAHASVLWLVVFGLGFVLFFVLAKLLVRFALVRIFGTVEDYQPSVRDRTRKILRRSF